MEFAKRNFLKFVSWSINLIKTWKMPWVKQILSGEQLDEILEIAQPGDILLVRAGGYFTSFLFKIFNIGKYTHCAFVSNKWEISDSTSDGVSKRLMLSTLVGYTHAAIVRPRLSEEEWDSAWDMYSRIMDKDETTPIEYNYSLVEDIQKDGRGNQVPDEVTCAQFIRLILNAGRKDYIDLRKRYGFLTVSPQDYYEAKSKFDLIKELD